MSPRIHQLPDDMIARIAAGEVVERPASVIKELVENSLDAGADHISITAEGAGRSRIVISDNGCGMTLEDAHLCLRRHATSKIRQLEDLERIASYGFRGEAIPSIASVSQFRLTTRSEEDDHGWELVLSGGKLISETPVARETGTTIEVGQLFFNTPARFKFLKSDQTEKAQILRVVEEMVFSSLGATFEIHSESGKPSIFRGTKIQSDERPLDFLRARVCEAWGGRWAQGLQILRSESPHFKVTGVITNQGYHQATPRYQLLYINKRPVHNRRLTKAIYDGYLGQLPSLRHPGWVLFLDIDPSTVDVNVHPAKREVKLTHESELFGFLNSAVKEALHRTADIPVQFFSAVPAATTIERGGGPSFGAPPAPSPDAPPSDLFKSLPMSSMQQALDELYKSEPMIPAFDQIQDLQDPNLRVIAQLSKTFIVAETQNGLLVADQHAAAEKVAYEALLANIKSREPNIQMMLVPFPWEVAISLTPKVQENIPLFARMGFLIEPFGGNTFLIKGFPAHLGETVDLHSLLDGICDELTLPTKNIEHRLAAMAACKSSVKAGDPLDLKACHTILKDLSRCENPFTCPHGRPTVIRLTYDDLLTRFRRK